MKTKNKYVVSAISKDEKYFCDFPSFSLKDKNGIVKALWKGRDICINDDQLEEGGPELFAVAKIQVTDLATDAVEDIVPGKCWF